MRHPLASAALLLALGAAPAAAVEPLALPPDALKAFQSFDEASALLDGARSAMKEVETGAKPKATSKDFEGAIAGYQVAADILKRSGGPAALDAGAYGVGLEELRSCATRPGALARLEKHARTLRTAAQHGVETRALLKSRLDAAHAADEARRYLVSTAARLGSAPELAEVFTWSWPELDASLSRSISAYAGELRRYQERADRGVADARARESALSSEAETFARAKDCALAGKWSGSKSQFGSKGSMSLTLASAGGAWSGSANLGSGAIAVRSVSIAGSNVSIAFSDGKTSLKGTLSPDGRTYQGFMSFDGPGSFTLHKE
jgi:hypothetical protein